MTEETWELVEDIARGEGAVNAIREQWVNPEDFSGHPELVDAARQAVTYAKAAHHAALALQDVAEGVLMAHETGGA